ncbi:hypothetical protein NDU88_002231 [Pleurodeles waltl]|uniref:Uncharacterized protein n=1 Tax=Pleurodeles waltl TaxID=8319 RepID=A0AAV7W1A3_PLEWA|nr:hypothetical protein NDU88_002231 [Pleurodeles waltl]
MGPLYRAVEGRRRRMQSQFLGSSRCEVWGSYDASGRPHGVAMTSQGCRRFNGVTSSRMSDLRHSGVSEDGQHQLLQRREAYRVVGPVEVHGLGAGGVAVLG